MSWMEAATRWYLVLATLTWAFYPAVSWLCNLLSDRGATISRSIAMLAALYPAWLLASIGVISFTSAAVAVVVVAAAVLGWALAVRHHRVNRAWFRALVLTELSSLLLFAAYVWLRGYTPRVTGTEKPMDVAFLASSGLAVTMPPPDPWFAGQPINYYYLGYLLHGTVGRLSGVAPETSFNLALATAFSMTAVAAFGVTWNVVRTVLGPRAAVASALFAASAVALFGNLYAPTRVLQDASGTLLAWWWDSTNGIGWRSSRIVCDGPRVDNRCSFPSTETINEFPFFSFLLGDLHPHVMALPYTVVAIALAWNLALRARSEVAGFDLRRLVTVALSGAFVGSLYALNAWDFPTFLLLMMVGVWIGTGASFRSSWKQILIVGGASILAWLPFFTTYVPPTAGETDALQLQVARLPVVSSLISGVGLHLGERTSIGEYLTVFGPPYAFGVALVGLGAARDWRAAPRGTLQTVFKVAAVTVIPGILLSAPVIPLCGVPLALAISQLRHTRGASAREFALVLFSFAWALSIGVEIVYVRDVFDDRMNTLFKFYYQSWTLYGLAAGVTLAVLRQPATRSSWKRMGFAAATVAALLAGLTYPTIAAHQWTEGFTTWRGLDGLAYGQETDPNDTAAIRWLGLHAEPGDIVLEAAGCSYLPFDRLPFNRVSAFTGVPTVIGWGNNHQRQWRAGQPELIEEIEQRQADVAKMYANPNSPLFDAYGVTWLFVGEYETGEWQSECDTAGPYDFTGIPEDSAQLWNESFRSGDTRIYRRLQEYRAYAPVGRRPRTRATACSGC